MLTRQADVLDICAIGIAAHHYCMEDMTLAGQHMTREFRNGVCTSSGSKLA